MTKEKVLELVMDRDNWDDPALQQAIVDGLKNDSKDHDFRESVIYAVQDKAGLDPVTLFKMCMAKETDTLSTVNNGKIVPAFDATSILSRMIRASDLDELEIPPITWIVKDILPTGLCMIGAPSKSYKSFMALLLCVCVCKGWRFLNQETTKAACLYLDLESTRRRPRDRLKMILGDEKKPDDLYILTDADGIKRIDNGFPEQIEAILTAHSEIKLVVVDVLQKIRPPQKRTQTGYDRDYDDMRELKQIADRHDVCVLLIHHTRKMKDTNDVFNDLSGSVGIMGALDAALVISKERRFDTEATLAITGRDLENQQLCISFNKRSMRWECLGTAEDVEAQKLTDDYNSSSVIATIKKLVAQNGGQWTGSAKDIEAASHYMGTHIYQDLPHIGNDIGRFEVLLSFDGISYTKKITKKANVYTFVSTVKTDDTVSTVSTVSTS